MRLDMMLIGFLRRYAGNWRPSETTANIIANSVIAALDL